MCLVINHTRPSFCTPRILSCKSDEVAHPRRRPYFCLLVADGTEAGDVVPRDISKSVEMTTGAEEPALSALSHLSAVTCPEPDCYTFLHVSSSFYRAAAKARGSNLRVHYKHMREVAHLIQGMKLSKSKQYLQVWTRISLDFDHRHTVSASPELSSRSTLFGRWSFSPPFFGGLLWILGDAAQPIVFRPSKHQDGQNFCRVLGHGGGGENVSWPTRGYRNVLEYKFECPTHRTHFHFKSNDSNYHLLLNLQQRAYSKTIRVDSHL